MRRVMVLLAALLLPTAVLPTALLAAPGDMSVAAFLGKADALKAKGAMAVFSGDISVLKAEGKAAGEAYRGRLNAERAAGRPSSCPPQGTKVNSDELLGFLRNYPTAARPQISMKVAIAEFFIRKYPCR